MRSTLLLTSSPTAPAMPYVTGTAAPENEIQRLRADLSTAIADPSLAPDRQALRFTDVCILTDEDYREASGDRAKT